MERWKRLGIAAVILFLICTPNFFVLNSSDQTYQEKLVKLFPYNLGDLAKAIEDELVNSYPLNVGLRVDALKYDISVYDQYFPSEVQNKVLTKLDFVQTLLDRRENKLELNNADIKEAQKVLHFLTNNFSRDLTISTYEDIVKWREKILKEIVEL